MGAAGSNVETRRERDRLLSAAEEAIQSIVITGPDGRIVYFNQAFADDAGRARGGLMGQALAPILTNLLGASATAHMAEKVDAGARWISEVEVGAPGGSRVYFQVAATPLLDADRSFGSCLVTLNDVTPLRSAKVELELESRVRVALAKALQLTQAEATLEQAAQSLCDQLVTLPYVEIASVHAYLGVARGFRVVGRAAPIGCPHAVGGEILDAWASDILERSRSGPWAQVVTADDAKGPWAAGLVRGGLKAAAFGPITSGNEVAGFMMIGTQDQRSARELVQEMPGLVTFGSTASAMLADRMLVLRREVELHESLKSVLASASFHPVFQPVVDLESREIVGFEALTRFDSGELPDRCFAGAWSAGLGPDLEIATLKASIAAAKKLPAGRWLGLNASPRLLADPGRLKATLGLVDRPLILEVTEHEVIEDYVAVREAIRLLGPGVRVAVDDAGAGVANFGHIVDLRPDFVKLDIGLIRNVNTNLGRQAVVVGMSHYSRTAGCRLVAEGVETEAEAETLRRLGVDFGQGFLFGHPAPAAGWADRRYAGAPAGHQPAEAASSRRISARRPAPKPSRKGSTQRPAASDLSGGARSERAGGRRRGSGSTSAAPRLPN